VKGGDRNVSWASVHKCPPKAVRYWRFYTRYPRRRSTKGGLRRASQILSSSSKNARIDQKRTLSTHRANSIT
jgi:hypothetical protein